MRRVSMLCLLGVLFAPLPMLAQAPGRIIGTVTDASSARPLSGVTVNIPGTSIGSLTGADGRYILTGVPAGSHTVRAAMIGFGAATQSATVAADQATTVDFTLQPEAVLLEGVVAVGYGTQQRRDVTGSVASVRAEDIRQIPTSNAIQAIQGRVAGVDIVRTSSLPGAGMNIRIRGLRSATASNEPLYVIDGVPISGGIQDFNPNNIESIEILKDASATAIYGSRGANGVVLITTRTGRPGQTQITYDTYAGMQRPINLVRMMDGPEFAAYKREATRAVPTRQGWTDEQIFLPEELAAIQSGQWTNWQREVMRTGFQQNHVLGLTGATDNTRFQLSGSFFGQDGITQAQGYDQYSGNVAVDHSIGRLRVGVNASASRSVQTLGPGNGVWGEALANSPLGVPYDENGFLKPKATSDPLRINPLIAIDQHRREITRNRIFGSLFSELQLMEGVNWRVNFGPDLSDTMDGEFRSRLARNNSPPDAFRQEDETFAYTLDNILQVNRNLGAAHRVDATLLYSIQEQREERTRAEAENLPYDHQLWYNLGTAETMRNMTSRLQEWALQSYMARVNYALHDRYLLTLTGRYDGSSRLAPENRWAFFPSIGLGWQLGDEVFIQNLGWFSDLKLRGSYGVTGNTAIDPYQTQGTLTLTRYNFGNEGAFGYRPGAIPNPDLTWERTEQANVGLDFGILRNRVTGAIDVYRQDTKDLLLSRALPPASGFTSTLQNVGQTRNTGLELAISTINLENWNGLRWTMDFNATTNKNEIVQLASGGDQVGDTWFLGHPIHVGNDALRSVFFDYEFAGIWQLNEAEQAAAFNQVPGEIRVVDQNGDGRITADDRIIIGNTYPKWIGSLSNRFAYGSVDLSVLASARLGYMFNDAFSTTNSSLYGRYGNMLVDYWTPENPSNVHPRPDAGREGPLYGSTRAYRKGDHVRIRNVTLGYVLPESLVGRWGGSRARVYATMQEPYIFTDYHGYDPEAGTSGGTPSYWTLLIGTNLTF
jgi:TonB-linked SusC/RagA family outer membrane protein